jgi:hypothetical protein
MHNKNPKKRFRTSAFMEFYPHGERTAACIVFYHHETELQFAWYFACIKTAAYMLLYPWKQNCSLCGIPSLGKRTAACMAIFRTGNRPAFYPPGNRTAPCMVFYLTANRTAGCMVSYLTGNRTAACMVFYPLETELQLVWHSI